METVLTAQQIADRLGISTSGVRRCARTYEKVHGELGKDSRGHRYYTETAAERIEAAHQAVTEGRAVSFEAALIQARDGQLPATLPSRGDALTLTLQDHGDRLRDFGERLATLEATLLGERDDLRRRLDYALGELRRREEMQQAPRRLWFRFRG